MNNLRRPNGSGELNVETYSNNHIKDKPFNRGILLFCLLLALKRFIVSPFAAFVILARVHRSHA